MKNSVTVSAPGKLMLFGEHAVLYDKPCIVTAVEPRMQTTVELLKESLFQLNAPDVFRDAYEKPINRIGKGDIPKSASFIEHAVKNFLSHHHGGIKVTTSSQFSLIGGLGSSSASVVSVLFGLCELFVLKLSKKELFDLAYKTVLDVQKTGSGFDVAAGVYGGTVYFKKGGAEIVSLDSGSIPLVVAFSGKKADTATLIQQVKDKEGRNSRTVQNIFKGIGEVVESARKALLKKEWEVLGELMNKNQELLEKLGVSNNSISVLIDAAKKAGAYGAKISGAGGGDCIIAVYDGSVKKRKAIEAALEKVGGKILSIQTCVEGVKFVQPMKATAKAPSNIAFIKYWGKKDEKLKIPCNGSISMNLSNLYTTTTVEFNGDFKKDSITIDGKKDKKAEQRVIDHLNKIRSLAKSSLHAKVVSKNSFPSSTGFSSSASGFAALTLAATNALSLSLSEKELSILARLGSGSACRSIPDGFVEWLEGNSHQTSYAHSLFAPEYWDLNHIAVVLSTEKKNVSTSRGQTYVSSSPFFPVRLQKIKDKIKNMKRILKGKNFEEFGKLIEEEALELHAVMMTSKPSLLYITPETIRFIQKIYEWRKQGLPVYFTLNTGHNVHVICQKKDSVQVMSKIKKLTYVKHVILSTPSVGVRIVEDHLF